PSSTLFPYTTLFRSHYAPAGPNRGAPATRLAARRDRPTAGHVGARGDLPAADRLGGLIVAEDSPGAVPGPAIAPAVPPDPGQLRDRKSTRLNSSHVS